MIIMMSYLQADVIVTSTSPGNFANCQGSAVSKALLAKAGVGLKVRVINAKLIIRLKFVI